MSNIWKQEDETSTRENEPDLVQPAATVWEVIDEIMSHVPDEILNRLPVEQLHTSPNQTQPQTAAESGKARRHFGTWDSGDVRSADNE